jgi:mono/diheme cytochrome c family protein
MPAHNEPVSNRLLIAGVASLGLVAVAVASLRATSPGEPPQAPAVSDAAAARAVIDRYCVTCHNQRLKTAGLALDALDLSTVGGSVEVWEKVVRKLRAHEMPPPNAPRPSAPVLARTAAWFEAAADAFAQANPNPGRVAVHRLNRREYANAIRDLLDLELDPRALLANDEPDQLSFENLASVLSVSPALLDNYLSAAYRVSRLALADPATPPVVETYTVPMNLVQDDRIGDDLPFGSQGGLFVTHHFPADGDYEFKVTLRRQLYLYLVGMGEPHQLDVRVDGKRVARFQVGGEGKGRTAPESFAGNTQGDPEWEVYMHTADEHLRVKVPVTAGSHSVGVSFVRRYREPEGILQPPQRGFARTTNELYYGSPAVDHVSIAGPFARADAASRQAPADSPSRRRIFTCRPAARRDSRESASEEPCARQILSALASRAYRRPLASADMDVLLDFFQAGRAEGGFESGIERGLERILASPSFLFRVVTRPPAPSGPFRLTDLDLASRLSFFVWSSIPDEALLREATAGRLRSPEMLRRQVRRLLADARSSALVDGFAIQWLKLGKIAGVVPDVDAFPDFDENLRDAMMQETRAFVATQLRENRPIPELISADYSFLNERLAKHYGIRDVYGSHMRKVGFTDGVRGGLLGQAAIMTATSYPNRTSPVLRGKWLLDTILGSPPPAPPPDVPSLEEGASKTGTLSMREQMEAHRRNPTCAACHVRMDPLGFSLENFDALGKYRTATAAGPVDSAATMPDGTEVRGVAGLKRLIAAEQDMFVRTFTEKLLSYALGRGIEASDMPAVRAIARQSASGGYRWSDIVEAIAVSTPFTMSTAPEAARPPGSPSRTSASR